MAHFSTPITCDDCGLFIPTYITEHELDGAAMQKTVIADHIYPATTMQCTGSGKIISDEPVT